MIETQDDGKIKDCRIVFNGVKAPDVKGSRPVRAVKTEAYLKGKSVQDLPGAANKICEEIGAMLKDTAKSVHTFEGKSGNFVSVRLALVRGFFTKFAVSCNEGKSVTSEFKSASRDLVVERGIVESKQEFPQNAADVRSAVYKPRPNITAHLQVRGKAVYVDIKFKRYKRENISPPPFFFLSLSLSLSHTHTHTLTHTHTHIHISIHTHTYPFTPTDTSVIFT